MPDGTGILIGRMARIWFRAGLAVLALALLSYIATAADPDPRLAIAAERIQAGSLAEAVDLLDAVVQENPDDPDAHLLLGSALSLIPRRELAIESLLRALELRPEHAQGYLTAGMAFARLAERVAAAKVFERAISLDPELGDAHLNLALILAGSEDYGGAAKHMAEALELETEATARARLRFLNGQLMVALGRVNDAVGEFERSLELESGSGEVHLALGMAQKTLLREDDAFPAFRKAVELAPQNPEAHYQLGLELQRRGDAGAAADRFLEANRLRPSDQSVVYNLSRALHQAGRLEESKRYRGELGHMIQAADKARENELETARLHGEAVRLEQDGDFAAAISKYREVLEFEPLNPVARRNLALALCRVERWDEGIAELRAILRDNPDDAETARALTIALDRSPGESSGSP